jgi:3-hydroxybutyryl-CoA dehydratase
MKFEELKVGSTYRFKKTISSKDVEMFAELSGDKNPVHLDVEFAKKSIFKGRIVHGMLVGAYFSKAIASNLPGSGSIYLNQTMQFIAPIYHNSLVEFELKVIKLKLEKRIVILETNCFVSGKIVIEGNAIVKCLT